MKILASLGLMMLTQSAFAEPCRESFQSQAASVHRCGGVAVVRLKGSPLERAATYGDLIHRGVLSRKVLDYFSNRLPQELAFELPWAAGPLSLLYNQLVRLQHRNTPPALSLEIDALAHSLGEDPIFLRRAMSLPDSALLLQGLGSTPGLGFLPALGCTSAVVQEEGAFAYGRNLDFAGVGTWDRHPMVLIHEPAPGSAGSELRHIAIGAEGLPFAGITGVNEAGITFAVHQLYSRDISLSGLPMLWIGELVLRSAKSLDEAVKILRENRPGSLWAFVLTDLNSGEALAVESSDKFFLVREREQGEKIFAQTNHAMHLESREWENASAAIENNSAYRLKQAFALLKKPTAPELATYLGSTASPEGHLSAYRDVQKALTLQTVIFTRNAEGAKDLYLSAGPAPAASGAYMRFSLADLFRADAPVVGEKLELANVSPAKRQALEQQAEAFRLYFDEKKVLEAAQLLSSHQTLAAALFRSVASYQAGRFEESRKDAEAALRDLRFLAEPAYIRDSLELTALAGLLQLDRTVDARTSCERLLGREGANLVRDDLRDLCLKLQRGGSAKPPALRFDFFSGDLNGRKN